MPAFDLAWIGGEHSFALNIGELEALQQATDSGPGEVLSRLYDSLKNDSLILGSWRVADIRDTVRLGLIGGGMDQVAARAVVTLAIDRHGLIELLPAAADILALALAPREDSPGKREGAKAAPENGNSEA